MVKQNMPTEIYNRSLYKIMIYLLKVLPMLMAAFGFLNTALSLCGIDAPLISFISGLSLLPLLFFWFSSYVFKFCEYHRLPLYYILIIDILNWIDYRYGFPMDNRSMLCVYAIVTFVCMSIFVYLRIKKI